MNSYFDEYDNLEKDMAKLVRDIVAERERQGISQGRLADMAGIKQSAISRIESLRALPQLDTLLRILRPLNLKLAVVQKTGEENEIMNIKIEGVTRLDAEVLSCKLKVTRSEDEYAYFITDEEEEFTTEEKDGVLVLRQKKRLFAHLFEKPVEAELRLPSNCANAAVKTGSGSLVISDISFSGLNAGVDNGSIKFNGVSGGDFKICSDNGKINLTDMTVQNIEAETDNGAITIERLTATDDIVCETDNGKIKLSEITAKNVGLRTDNGKLILENIKADKFDLNSKNGTISAILDAPESDFAMEIVSKSGSAFVGGKKYNGSFIYKDNDKTKHISAKTKYGRINIAFSDTDERYKENDESGEEDCCEDLFSFELPDLSEIGDIVRGSMQAAKQVIKNHIRKTDDGIVVQTPERREKIVIVDKNGKRTVNVVDGDDIDGEGKIIKEVIEKHIIKTDDGTTVQSPGRREKIVIIDKNGKRTVNVVDDEEIEHMFDDEEDDEDDDE